MAELQIQPLLDKYVHDPNDPENNYWLAWEYEKIGQNAAALSYYLRCAELSNDKDLVYECLLKTWLCVHKSKRRPWYEEQQLLTAITYNPKRPEAYYLLSSLYGQKEKWKECAYYANVGYELADFNSTPCRTDVHYPGHFSILFQKAFSSWYIGQREECKVLWQEVASRPDIDEYHLGIANNNLKNFGYDENYIKSLHHKEVMDENKIDIILQGPYKPYVLDTAKFYQNLSFVNKVIISCWQDDDTPKWYPQGILIVKNSKPKSDGTANRNLQIVSSLGGLNYSKTKYALKMRNDQRYTLESLELMNTFFHEHKEVLDREENDPHNRIFTSGIFEGFPFHPRDGIFWGNREDLIRLFSCPLDSNSIHDRAPIGKREYWKFYNSYIRTESYLGSHYCAHFNDEIKHYLLNPDKYLYDGAPEYNTALTTSDRIIRKYFKSFPREGVDLEWPTYGWKNYPYDNQYNQFNERWHEHGY